MRLTAIKLAGFKSFVEPTTLRLHDNLTGVVGPNGCGKSNVIDAVRWVTGESSAKQLRGEALEDVIFNGSKARKPVGRASVELVFDNGEGRLGGQYAAFAEIAIKRELSRDGNSNYSINGARCRRRDVVDLFLGTGLGGRSNYAVIEQGAVNRLVEAKPEDMRQVLEEAAGISRYKERRRETENRIRHTRENLDRLNDLIGEVSQRLAQLQRQAANAEKYKRYKADERKLRAEYLALRWRALDSEAEQAQARVQATGKELESAREQARAVAAKRDAHLADQQACAHECQRLQADFYGAEAEVARVEQALAHARELDRLRRTEIQGLEHQAVELAERLDAEIIGTETLKRALDEGSSALDALDEQAARAGAALEAAERDAADSEGEWDALAAAQDNPLRRAEAQRARLEQLEREEGLLAQRLDKLLGERGRLDSEAPLQALAQADDAVQRLAAELEAVREDHQAAEAEAARLREGRGALDAHVHETRQALSDARGRLASLEALQQAALREDDADLRAWLAAQGWSNADSVAHAVRVADGWEVAAEAALGPFLRALCVGDLTAIGAGAADGHSAWPEQALTLVEAGGEEPARSGAGAPRGARALATVLAGPPALRGLARDIFLVEDQAAARAALGQLTPGQVLVTRQGLCFGPGWLSTPRRGGDEDSLLVREQRIAELRRQTQRLTTGERDRSAELDGLRQRIEAAELRRSAQSERLDELRRRHGEALAERQGLAVRSEQIQRRRRELDGDIEELRTQHALGNQELATTRDRLDDVAEAARDFVARRQALQEQLKRLREAVESARRAGADVTARQQSLRVELAAKHSATDAAEQRLEDLRGRRQRVLERQQLLAAEAAAAAAPEDAAARAKGDAETRRDAARKALEAARTRLSTVEAEAAEISRRAAAAADQVELARDEAQTARLAFEAVAVRRQTLEEQLAEAGHAPQALCAELAPDAEAADWEERIETLERRISRLGAINLAAIEEFEGEQEREGYLQSQYADLMAALAVLEKAIAKIDRETRSRFRETFENANRRFNALFPTLFGGGEARLELTEDDLLATGVRVMARPPGKRNASIQMLSGGEKALTAVALLFALFELNPAPFCLLDEIDAPLDDANVARFCDLVRRMAETVQFVVITHNKLTMELVQRLHGVTMQEPGVSRLVSVDIEQALELAS